MKRIFIESDIVDDAQLRRLERNVYNYWNNKGVVLPDDIFDEVIDRAWHDPERAWNAIKEADEIYAVSSLTPLLGYGTYTGAPVVFNTMMQKIIDTELTGKSLILQTSLDDIDWDDIDPELLDKAFKKNFMYVLEWNDAKKEYELNQIDINNIIRTKFKN